MRPANDSVYSINSLPYDRIREIPIQKRKAGNPGGSRRKVKYKDVICAFDIETTALDRDRSIMYIWQMQIGEYTVTGRSWKEFLAMLQRIAEGMAEGEMFVVFVHNLSFEFQFLRGRYHFRPEDVFCTDSRRVLRCDMYKHFEFRCAYLHSNMSLREFLRKMGVEHQKTELDYTVRRYPWTPLSKEEIEYCLNDVRGLCEALRIEMEHDGDSLYTLPLTSTGYVRRDAKKAMRQVRQGYVRGMLPDLPVYGMLRESFRGGNVHANRYFAGQIIHGVQGADRSSSYPECQCNEPFPISEFRRSSNLDFDYVCRQIYKRGKAALLRIRLWSVHLRDPYWPVPYLAVDKCRHIMEAARDNGRILAADYLETTVTDIDFRIILREYDFASVEVAEAYFARYGYLPDALVSTIESYYTLKTRLKGVSGSEILYTKSKNKLNSIYGMSAQNPIRQTIEYRDRDYIPKALDIVKAMEEYHHKAFFPYQWGVWTTARARERLEDGIRLVHETPGAEVIYVDTDSVKYTGSVDFLPINKVLREKSEESGAYADDPGGIRHYMGVWESEGKYKEFATLGSKKYVYRTEDGVLHVTIAGVTKSKGGPELEAAGGIEAFLRPGFIFQDAGGNDIRYNDRVDEIVKIDGRRVRVTSCATIVPSTYKLGITQEYEDLLEHPESILEDFVKKSEISDFLLDKYGPEVYTERGSRE